MSGSEPTTIATIAPTGAEDAVPGLRKATGEDLPSLSRTLTAAFFDDPVFRWAFPDPDRRRAIQPRFFAIVGNAYLPYEQIYTTDGVVAGAIWTPPGVADDDDALAKALGEVSGENAPRVFQAFELMAEQHPQDAHSYLFLLGTRPEWQSRGIGSALMEPVLDRCDRHGTPAYLEATSERNKSLYLRHGFEVVGEIRLPEGPSLWPMWREPRRAVTT